MPLGMTEAMFAAIDERLAAREALKLLTPRIDIAFMEEIEPIQRDGGVENVAQKARKGRVEIADDAIDPRHHHSDRREFGEMRQHGHAAITARKNCPTAGRRTGSVCHFPSSADTRKDEISLLGEACPFVWLVGVKYQGIGALVARL